MKLGNESLVKPKFNVQQPANTSYYSASVISFQRMHRKGVLLKCPRKFYFNLRILDSRICYLVGLWTLDNEVRSVEHARNSKKGDDCIPSKFHNDRMVQNPARIPGLFRNRHYGI